MIPSTEFYTTNYSIHHTYMCLYKVVYQKSIDIVISEQMLRLTFCLKYEF